MCKLTDTNNVREEGFICVSLFQRVQAMFAWVEHHGGRAMWRVEMLPHGRKKSGSNGMVEKHTS